MQRRSDARGQRFAELIVADPRIEQVAEDVDALGGARRTFAEGVKCSDQRGPRRRKVEVRNEQRRLYATSSTRWMTMSSVGTF